MGAGGESLGATGIAGLQIAVESTGSTQMIPCYILDFSKPIWREELQTCGELLGTNALGVLGFQITQADGTAVVPDQGVKQVGPSSEGNTLYVTDCTGQRVAPCPP